MSNELIPQDSAQGIIRQAHEGMHEAIANQTELSKQQLVQMMIFQFNKALQEYIDTTARKLDEFTPKM